MKDKYKDQDEEDRELMMKILGVSISHVIIMVSVGSGADKEDIRGQY